MQGIDEKAARVGVKSSQVYDDYKCINGNKGIGVISDYDEQPIYLNSRFGPFCTVTSGFVENAEELATKLLKMGISFSEVRERAVNTPELIAKLINQGDDLIDGIEKMFDVIDGSCSLLLLHKDGIYAARDRFGYTPLIVGKRADGWAVTAETSDCACGCSAATVWPSGRTAATTDVPPAIVPADVLPLSLGR